MDVTQILLWMVLALGGGFVSVITWSSLRIVGEMDGIKTELRALLIQHDHRITVLEVMANAPLDIMRHK